ncbi:hypothetical protein BJY21_000121 [Kineosphaera limosa]|uniref:DNA-binding protein n=1 Tax=Kineosphaera limosa NBRC 100340 TaxID=1184609 RepID=K6VEX2_9MICO|nr:hypothetical protein [Kineosphaera limosa]NYD98936.1 hypothetical protein [Kineosphaera limosa]GAB94738.1 hypothetical protein KILIM_011_00110 [Kineosphaera limosa NBRC 100340]
MDATENPGAGEARRRLLDAGAAQLERPPWRHPNEAPVEDVVLLRFALWRASAQPGPGALSQVEAALGLLESARSDLEALETALLFTARAEGLTWARIAELLGLRSAQAAQQRYQRISERPGRAGSDAGERAGADGASRR